MAIITAEINSTDIPFFKLFFEKMKAKNIHIEDSNSDATYTKEAFFEMIESSRKGSFSNMNKEERKKLLLE